MAGYSTRMIQIVLLNFGIGYQENHDYYKNKENFVENGYKISK